MEEDNELTRTGSNVSTSTRPVQNSDDGNNDGPPIRTRPVNYTNNNASVPEDGQKTSEE